MSPKFFFQRYSKNENTFNTTNVLLNDQLYIFEFNQDITCQII